MIELGELEAKYEEFEKRKLRVVVVSLEEMDKAEETQKGFPHLLVISDAERKMSEAFAVIHPGSNPMGGDTSAPTTFLIDANGTVRWTFRPEKHIVRLTPAQLLEAIDEHLLK